MRRRAILGGFALAVGLCAGADLRAEAPSPFDDKAALAYSQAAIGRTLTSHGFLDRRKKPVDLMQFRGKPLVVSMIYTSCYHTCPMIMESLYDSVKSAQNVLGKDSFQVVTIGFDAKSDTPARMRAFAKTRGVSLPNWRFLSGSEETIQSLSRILGFIYFPSPKGFDHLSQVTIVDRQGAIYRHVYGSNFTMPALVEPLKELVFGRRKSAASLDGILDRVRLFCTIYDPRNDRYHFDYSIFVGLTIGFLILLGMASILIRNAWRIWRAGRTA